MLSLELGVAAGNQVALRTGPFWGWTVGRRHQRHGTRPVRRVRRADCAAQVKTRPRTITRIPVIFVNGPGVTGDEVLLEDADRYRLLQLRPVLRPTGSSVFELRSFLGGAFDGIGGKAGMRVAW